MIYNKPCFTVPAEHFSTLEDHVRNSDCRLTLNKCRRDGLCRIPSLNRLGSLQTQPPRCNSSTLWETSLLILGHLRIPHVSWVADKPEMPYCTPFLMFIITKPVHVNFFYQTLSIQISIFLSNFPIY